MQQRTAVFAALDNGFKGPHEVGPHPLGAVISAFFYLMSATTFARPLLDHDHLFDGARIVPDGTPKARIWLSTPLGAAFATHDKHAAHPEQRALHLVSPRSIRTRIPEGCVPFRMRIDRARDIYCEHRPTATYFEWIPHSERLVDTGDFRPTYFTMGGVWPPPQGRPVAALLNVTLLTPDRPPSQMLDSATYR